LIPHATRRDRHQLVRELCVLLLPMLTMPLLGAWYIATMPQDSREWVLGGSPTMSMFLIISVGASTLIGLYAMLGLVWGRLYINTASALVLVSLAFGATAGGEFVREGVRKPFTIREVLYSNGIRADEVPQLREQGLLNQPGIYPLQNAESYPTDQVRDGALVYRQLCCVCHTLDGVNALDELTRTWTTDQKRLNFAQLQRTKAFMPPFAGNAAEVEALVQFLTWRHAKQPSDWPAISDQQNYAEVLRQIATHLQKAGPFPADPEQRLNDLIERANGRASHKQPSLAH
jgi:mono/diheme cytochrome c family protein